MYPIHSKVVDIFETDIKTTAENAKNYLAKYAREMGYDEESNFFTYETPTDDEKRVRLVVNQKSIYNVHGYDNRAHYLRSLAEEHGADEETVFTLANLLGPNEDFDGLVTSLEDEL